MAVVQAIPSLNGATVGIKMVTRLVRVEALVALLAMETVRVPQATTSELTQTTRWPVKSDVGSAPRITDRGSRASYQVARVTKIR